jgi:hypothetical protein
MKSPPVSAAPVIGMSAGAIIFLAGMFVTWMLK